MKLFKCYTEKKKRNNWTDLSLLGQEPTFKIKTVGNVNNVDGMTNSIGYEKLSYLGLHSFPKSITQSVKTN